MHVFSNVLHNSPQCFNIVGIDPGTNTVGFSVYTYNPLMHCVTRSAATTLVGAKMIRYDPYVDVHGERSRRIAALGNVLCNMFFTFNPVAVICEHPFYNSSMPSAFESLIEGVGAIRNALFSYDPNMRVIPVDPSSAKKAIGASGAAKKDVMRDTLLSISPALAFDSSVFGINLVDLDEHSVDALAVGKWFINQLW